MSDSDPRVHAALAATQAELARMPTEAMPGPVAARLDAAFAQLDASTAVHTGLVPASRQINMKKRRRGAPRRLPLLTAAATAFVLAVGLPELTGTAAGSGVVLDGPDPAGLAAAATTVLAARPGAGAAGERFDAATAPFQDGGAVPRCLAKAGAAREPEPTTALGGRAALFAGQPALFLVLGTRTLGRFRVVVVTPGCTAVLTEALLGQ